ncbi:MAG: hypothetical protein HYS77_00725 [Candidatus Rokubacteria bacterium]|nr:hypothetical protein [Candidatus Rokubacteria bacterium]
MDPDAFRRFEQAAHDRVARGYHDFFEPVTSSAGLVDVTVSPVAGTHRLAGVEAWWRGGLGSLARASAAVLGQPPGVQARIRAAFEAIAGRYVVDDGLDVPFAANVAAARKP